MPTEPLIIQQDYKAFRIGLVRKGFVAKRLDFPTLFEMVC